MERLKNLFIDKVNESEDGTITFETQYEYNINNEPIENIVFQSKFKEDKFSTTPIEVTSLDALDLYQLAVKRTYSTILKMVGKCDIISEGEIVFGICNNKNPFVGEIVSIDYSSIENNIKIALYHYKDCFNINLFPKNFPSTTIFVSKENVCNVYDSTGLDRICNEREKFKNLKISFNNINTNLEFYNNKLDKLERSLNIIEKELNNLSNKEVTNNRVKSILQKKKGERRLRRKSENIKNKVSILENNKKEILDDVCFTNLLKYAKETYK